MEVNSQLATSAALLSEVCCLYPLDKELNRFQSQSEFVWEESNLCSLVGIEQ
jgi:hypothetical protein